MPGSVASIIQTAAFLLSLGLDTLIASTAISLRARSDRERNEARKNVYLFAFSEAAMVAAGLFVGQSAARWLGVWATIAAGAVLVGAGGHMFFEKDEDGGAVQTAVWMTALGVGGDELAAGFSMGMRGAAAGWVVFAVAVQAVAFATVGMAIGQRKERFFLERLSRVPAALLVLIGLWMLAEALTGGRILKMG